MNLETNLTQGQEFPNQRINELREKKELKNTFTKNQHFLGDMPREISGSIVEVLKWKTAKIKI